jgi:hypothetical protein
MSVNIYKIVNKTYNYSLSGFIYIEWKSTDLGKRINKDKVLEEE